MNAAITYLENFGRNVGDPDDIHMTLTKGNVSSHFGFSSPGAPPECNADIAGYVLADSEMRQRAAKVLADLRQIDASR